MSAIAPRLPAGGLRPVAPSGQVLRALFVTGPAPGGLVEIDLPAAM